ncbi:metallophosphoesterase [Streptomyces sp. VRA16 Mangrove soil]|uniref:metallophosphoesterase n=1 Tax=Streptomyces sp. VRA16 Mangrove soil TaxID=2817434 RepID=UPI001A9E2A0F|nr:metallophosphoesterase [Streptomyces sp. VRA16 Mangrove soil]MBO1334870.1 metallophosphoesterase [Streptomyces sp. VRA16 Mangrove soil]
MIVLFVLIAVAVLAVLAGFHRYAWRRLVRDTTAGPGWPRRLGTAVFVAGPVLMIGALVAERAGAPFLLQRMLGWPGFLWMAFALYLLLALLVGEVVRPLLRRLLDRRAASQPAPLPEPGNPENPESAAAPTPPAAPTRRLVLARTVGAAATVAAAGIVAGGTYGVLRGPAVKRVTVPLAKLPRSAHGFRITVVSDVHLGPVLGRGFAERVVDLVNSTQPDLIAVVGDLVDGSVEDLAPAVAPLARLRARHGTYFVTGNHEYFSGADPWVEHVREIGLRPLENARVEMGAFDLAGVNDITGASYGEGPDYAKALGDRDTSRAAVLLAHQPVMIHEAVRHGVDLQLSGHTHGGQLWPGNFVADAANPTLAGLERHGDTQLYVSRGAGAWGPPVRVGAPSDITVVELASRRA